MTQVPDHIWKEIANHVELRSEWMKTIINSEDIAEALDEDYNEKLKEFEHDSIGAFHEYGTLLLEHRAISSWINKNNAFDLRSALPEILSIDEIDHYFKGDRMHSLTLQQKHEVELMILRELNNNLQIYYKT